MMTSQPSRNTVPHCQVIAELALHLIKVEVKCPQSLLLVLARLSHKFMTDLLHLLHGLETDATLVLLLRLIPFLGSI